MTDDIAEWLDNNHEVVQDALTKALITWLDGHPDTAASAITAGVAQAFAGLNERYPDSTAECVTKGVSSAFWDELYRMDRNDDTKLDVLVVEGVSKAMNGAKR